MGMSWRELQKQAAARRAAKQGNAGSSGGSTGAEVPGVMFVEPPSIPDSQCAEPSTFDPGTGSCTPV